MSPDGSAATPLHPNFSRITAKIAHLMETIETEQPVLLPTVVYNENWLLRLLLAAAAGGADCLPFRFAPGARWVTEPSLIPAFQREGNTRADGLVGHFDLPRLGTRAGIRLRPDARQFVVAEGKMFSGLSAGVTHSKGYDQASRSIACMAQELVEAGLRPSHVGSLGYYILAPESQIEALGCRDQMSTAAIRRCVEAELSGSRGVRNPAWKACFDELLDVITIEACSWEDVIQRLQQHDPEQGHQLEWFYARCVQWNRPAQASRRSKSGGTGG